MTIRRVFRLGSDVQIELISTADEDEESTSNESSLAGSNTDLGSLSLDLEGFSGRLVVTHVAPAAAPVEEGEAPNAAVSNRSEPVEETKASSETDPPSRWRGKFVAPRRWRGMLVATRPSAVSQSAPPGEDVTARGNEDVANENVVRFSVDLKKESTSSIRYGEEAVADQTASPQFPPGDTDAVESSNGKDVDGSDRPSEVDSADKETPLPLAKVGPKNASLKNAWGHMRYVIDMKRHVPKDVKERRVSRQGSSDPPPSALHEVCAQPDVTLAELLTVYDSCPMAVSVKDSRGCLPLHILSDNDALLQEPAGRDIASIMTLTLMKAYPDGITVEDDEGRIPFVALIEDWMNWVYQGNAIEATRIASIDTVLLATGAAARVLEAVSSRLQTASHRSQPEGDAETPSSSAAGLSAVSTQLFPVVDMWEEVEWCFSMLSVAMDQLGGKSGGLYKKSFCALIQGKKRDLEMREKLAKCLIARFPNTLLKTLLLLENDGGDTRKRVFKMSIIRRVLLCPESVGPWLINMLQQKGVPARRAVDYLLLISKLSVEDLLGRWNATLPTDLEVLHEQQERVFEAVDALDGTMASLVVLPEQETERAASADVVWFIMNKNLARPFVVSLVLIDFVLHLTLLLAFRNDVAYQDGGDDGVVEKVPTSVVIVICSHYLIRKTCEALSLLYLSTSVFQSYFMNIWTLFDLMAIILTLAAVVWNENHPDQYRNGLNALVLGLLWIKVLAFLKVVNKQMATFILALIQILKDIRFFMIVLLVILVMFADMFIIAVATKDDGEFCYPASTDPEENPNLSDPAVDFCSSSTLDSLLRVYALLLGDFALVDYQQTSGMTVLFVIFTLLGVIIMLNVLIAVISDSYEKAKISSLLLFGRARVAFVAQNQALESFLRTGEENPLSIARGVHSAGTALVSISQLGRWLVLLSLIGTAFVGDLYIVSTAYSLIVNGEDYGLMVFLILMGIILTLSLWVAAAFSCGNLVRACLPGCLIHWMDACDGCTESCVRFLAGGLFGLQDTVRIQSADDEVAEVEEEWTGRLGYIEKSVERTVESAKEELLKEMQALEMRMKLQQEGTHQIV